MPKKPAIYNNEQANAANALAAAIVQPEELDVFSGNLIQTSIINEQIVECHPISPLVHMEPIVIECPASYTAMTDPFFLLNITAKVVNGDGKALKADARVAPINLTLHSIFRDAVLKINGTIVSQATGTYPYKALIETTYTYSKQAKEGAVGIPQMFYKETAGKFNALDDGNKGFVARRAKFITSTDVEMMGRLNINVLLQPKLFVPGLNFSLALYQSPDNFRIMSGAADADQKLLITKCVLLIRRVHLTPSTLLTIEQRLLSRPARYTIFHSVVRGSQIVAGTTQLSNFMLSNGQVPRLVLITLVSSTGFQGHYAVNPFDFSLKKTTNCQVSVNGRLHPPLPYNFQKSKMEPYLNMLKCVNKMYADTSNDITLDDFSAEGYQVLAFDLSPDQSGSSSTHVSPRQNGVVTLNMEWPVGQIIDNTTMLAYLMWDSTVVVDGRKNIILDYIP